MSRIVISLAVVIALMVLSVAVPCLACSLPNPDMTSTGSCCHHGGCEKPSKAPAPACGAPDFGLAAAGQASTPIAHAAAVISTPVIAEHDALILLSPLAFSDSYSPPPIYLLNSVLIV